MTVIRTTDQPLTLENSPDWCQIPRAGFFRMPSEGGEHDRHYHDFNELYLICRGKAKILNGDGEYYIHAGDIVCIKAGDEHDILEIYGDDDLELFWLYEPAGRPGRFGHLHRTAESAQPHPVAAKPVPPDFPG
jgi:mannose-6-phosphate isomerase-like protein (cupin superfamily)